MKLSLGFSTCPNDTFMFEALVNKRIQVKGYEFELFLADVEELNKKAMKEDLDISKISIASYPYFASSYQILSAGGAIGTGNGPVLVSKNKIYPDELDDLLVAVPGNHTTAKLLMTIMYPEAKNLKEFLFSDIENAVLSNETDAGVIIHENRFTYQEKGLRKIVDLGEEWEKLSHLPLPLGGIVIKRNLSNTIKTEINKLLAESIRFALDKPLLSLPFIKNYAQNLDEAIIFQHIKLFVNEYSAQMGEEGKEAIRALFNKGIKVGSLPEIKDTIFAD
jgi:1,4-dihydroxy-6-naphthoate synthase